ncbi:Flagellar biosynthesis pathway, component FlhA [Treponema sp. JC4]|uniref:FHIPEP family type III secretion protein n=1 Tax=Treponema sp. JC4 TaxID=1124982 RepID=UPI00025B0CE2|nr:FHIPEP family type III secretion protein [Treponema sp. JC4]EID83914.1 Flagellar biosynthesis pathway, component FlhA [Treponema sp. JC4]
MKKRRPRIYDNENYSDFAEQPSPLEVQLGSELMPLLDEQTDCPLLRGYHDFRNVIDAEYGLPLPTMRIRYNMILNPCEYKILLHGTEVGGFKYLNSMQIICLDTGDLTGELSGEKIKEPAYGLNGIIVAKEKADEAKRLGYAVTEPSDFILGQIFEIIRKNRTKFLNQCMVNTLINKVRDTNPDVVDDVFFMHNFSTSKFKTILNWLLAEGFSIRDMNSILEAMADNIDETKNLVELLEKIREKLVWQLLSAIADKDKIIHVIRVSKTLSKALSERIYYPQSYNELPYYTFSLAETKVFAIEMYKKAICMQKKDHLPIFVIVSNLRTALANTIRQQLGREWICISDKELCSVITDYSVVVEEVLEINEIKVNE